MGKELSKRFVLKLSGKAETVSLPYTVINQQTGEMDKKQEEFSVRSEEVSMLTKLFEIASEHQTSFKKINECLDCIGALESLSDSDDEIVLTKDDLDYLNQGAEKTVGRRPSIWSKLRKLTAQLGDPQEKKDEPKAVEKTAE